MVRRRGSCCRSVGETRIFRSLEDKDDAWVVHIIPTIRRATNVRDAAVQKDHMISINLAIYDLFTDDWACQWIVCRLCLRCYCCCDLSSVGWKRTQSVVVVVVGLMNDDDSFDILAHKKRKPLPPTIVLDVTLLLSFQTLSTCRLVIRV